MTQILLDFLAILALLLANGVFAMSEMALVAARRARLQEKASAGDKRAIAAVELAKDPADFLATLQLGITIVGTLAGAVGGATLARVLAERFAMVPVLEPYSGFLGLASVVVIITFLEITIGELVPKRLALRHPERISMLIARPMRIAIKVCAPVVKLLNRASDLLVKRTTASEGEGSPVTEEEIRILLDQGIRAGTFELVERAMISNVFRLSDRRVGGLMTHRADVVWLDVSDPPEEVRRKMQESNHARYVVAEGDLDHVVGIVRVRDLLPNAIAGERFDLRAALQKPLFIPETLPAFKVMEMFKRTRQHLALVLDEYGGFQGLVTIGDILGSIVGDIPDHGEVVEHEAVQREDGSWLLDGAIDMERVRDLLRLPAFPPEEKNEYSTLAGFTLFRLGHIPQVGEQFDWNGVRFEVVDLDGQRIDRLLVHRLPDEEAPAP